MQRRAGQGDVRPLAYGGQALGHCGLGCCLQQVAGQKLRMVPRPWAFRSGQSSLQKSWPPTGSGVVSAQPWVIFCCAKLR
mmetsp:Transcript_68992/g.215551  ORF Transcript_68992/g.215551 Transcript_68992/m.215551 type:complete len:80 (-) Transcript_68992:1226-1465(-)